MRLIQTGTIQRQTQSNVGGEIQTTWADSTVGISCLIQEKAGRVQFGPAGANLEYDSVCFVRFGTDVKPQAGDDKKDRLVMTAPARLAGATFLIQHVADESGMGRGFLTLFLQRTRGA